MLVGPHLTQTQILFLREETGPHLTTLFKENTRLTTL